MSTIGQGFENNALQNINFKEATARKVNQKDVSVEKEPSLSKDSAKLTKTPGGTVPKGTFTLVTTGEQVTEEQFMQKIRKEKRVAAATGIGVVVGLISGAGIMLTSKSLPMMAVGAVVTGSALLLPNIVKGDGKGTASGAVAYAGAMASMTGAAGAAMAVYKLTGNSAAAGVTGAVVAGAGILATISASKEIKN